MKTKINLFVIFIVLLSIKSCMKEEHTYKLYILAGQSNMEGLGLVEDLPDSLNRIQSGVWIYHPNSLPDGVSVEDKGSWEELRPGHGSGYSTNGEKSFYSDKFGVELSFVQQIQTLEPSSNIALFKYARGGASIHVDAAGEWGSWSPNYENSNGVNQWGHFVHHLKRALAVDDIDGDGKRDVLLPAGILWLQGESDASHTKEIADAYYDNLKELMDLMRVELNADVPVIVASISESYMGRDANEDSNSDKVLRWSDIVIKAQKEYANKDTKASFILPPENIGWLDPWHYDSETYIELGKSFANEIYKLHKIAK